MVFFTCGGCGESLKKAQVDKHVLKCRSCRLLSCIDCGTDFRGDDYKNHIKCISEDQKYGGRDFQAKESKGDVKQQLWIQRIQQVMERPDVEPNVKKILQKVSAYDNVPRKRAKFENWMKNCLKIYTPFLLEKVWEICSAAADSNTNQTSHQTASERENRSDTNGSAETSENKRDERKNKKHKRKTSDENSEEQNGENNEKQTRKKRKREEKEQNGENKDESERRGDDYKNHNKCISEDQKHSGKNFQVKEIKGDVKQQLWIQRIQQVMERPDVEPNVWQVLQMVITHNNVPRKRAKFENWMKNCLKIYTPFLLEKVWEICSAAADSNTNQTSHQTASERENRSDTNGSAETSENKRDERKNKKHKRKTSDENSEEQNGENNEKQTRKKRKREEKEQNGENNEKQTRKKRKREEKEQNGENNEKQTRKKRKREEKEQNGENADENSNKKQKKRKQESFEESLNPEGEEPENQESESKSTGKFNWKGTIKAVLKDAPEDGLAVKKLRKKVLAAYYSFSGDSNFRSEEELLSLFNKKINSNPKFKILKDRVRLVK